MASQAYQLSVYYLLLALTHFHWSVKGNNTFIQAGKSTEVVIPPYGESSFTVQNISQSFSYVTLQAHTQRENVSVSSSQMFESSVTITGSHVGIVNLLEQSDEQSTMYLKSDVNMSLNVVVHAELHTSSDPVPGACNQIFKLEIDPNIHISSSRYMTVVDFQWGNVGFKRQGRQSLCEQQTYQSRLRYDIYVYFLSDQEEDTFLSDMSKMLSAGDVVKNGRKVLTVSNTGSTQSLGHFSAAKGQGVVYAVVVSDVANGTMSSYIPVQTYACQLGDADCSRTYRVLDVIIAILCGILGLFLCFLGHRYLKTEFFVFGFIGFLLIFFIVLTKGTALSTEASFGVSIVLGVVGGGMFLMFWYYCGIPVMSVLLVGLVAGYLVSSVIFYSPFGNLSYWDSALTFGLTFTCGLLIGPVFLLCFTRTLNILACTFVGSYMCVICVDIFLWSSLKYIILASIYRQTVPDYLGITVIYPFGKNEIILTLAWAVFFIIGSAFQFIRERKKAPFPPCPAHVKRSRRLERPTSRPGVDEERAPLLDERSRRQYTVGQPQSGRSSQQAAATAPPIEHNEPT